MLCRWFRWRRITRLGWDYSGFGVWFPSLAGWLGDQGIDAGFDVLDLPIEFFPDLIDLIS